MRVGPSDKPRHIYAPGADPLGFVGSLCPFHNGTRSYDKVAITEVVTHGNVQQKASKRTFGCFQIRLQANSWFLGKQFNEAVIIDIFPRKN